MAQRTTIDKVGKRIKHNVSIDLQPFIDTAVALTDYLDSKDTDNILTSALLIQIEEYLACHFYAHRDQQYSNKSTGGASGTFQGQTGMMLESTQWGQTAMLLDVTGILVTMNDKQTVTAKLTWAGNAVSTDSKRPDSEDDNY